MFRRPRPDFPRGHSRIDFRAQNPRHDVRAIARDDLLTPLVRPGFSGAMHGDEALLPTKRRHTAADHAHRLSSNGGSDGRIATQVPSVRFGLIVHLCTLRIHLCTYFALVVTNV